MEKNTRYKKKTSQFLPYITAGILVFLINYLCIRGNENIATIVSLLYLLFVFTQPTEDFLLYVIMATPSTRSMEVFGASVSVWVCLEYLIKREFKRKIKVHKEISVPLALYILYAIQFFVRFDSFMYGFLQPFKIVIVLWFLYSYAEESNSVISDRYKLKTALFLWIAGIAMALLPVLMTTSIIGRISAYNNDSNTLAVQSAFVLACASVLFMSKERNISFGQYLVIVAISLVTCLVCGSRNGFLSLGIVAVSTVLLNLNGNRLGKNIIITMAVAGIIAFSMSTTRVQLYLSSISRRLDLLEQTGNLSNGRFQLWEEYINAFNANKVLWLIGMGTFTNYGLSQMAHNMFIEDVASYGIVGIVILLCAYSAVLRKVLCSSRSEGTKLRLFGYVPFLLPLIAGFTLHSMTNIPNTVMLYIGISILGMSAEEKRS